LALLLPFRLGFRQSATPGSELLVLGFSAGVGFGLAHIPFVTEHRPIVKSQELVEFGLPVLQEDLLAAACLA